MLHTKSDNVKRMLNIINVMQTQQLSVVIEKLQLSLHTLDIEKEVFHNSSRSNGKSISELMQHNITSFKKCNMDNPNLPQKSFSSIGPI